MRGPFLYEGEKIILQAQGSLQEMFWGSSWKLGHLYLTNKRLSFIQVTKRVFGASLDEVRDLRVVKRVWLLGVRVKQLRISLKCGGRKKAVYIALEKPEKWIEMIKESMTLMLADKRWYDGSNSEPGGHAQ